MLTSIDSKANANANKNNIILMFRSQKAQNKKEIKALGYQAKKNQT